MLTSAQAADVLGVRLSTIYAYVSRGVLTSSTAIDARGRRVSHFDRDEVLALARARARTSAGSLAILLESDVTQLDPQGSLRFRGHDIAQLAADSSFEQAADMLWQVPHHYSSWALRPEMTEASRVALTFAEHMPLPADRMQLALTVGAAHDSSRHNLTLEHVVEVGRAAIRLMTSAAAEHPVTVDHDVATALWIGATGRSPTSDEHHALSVTLVCLMDHELTASTMAARAAAGTHAEPWMVLLAGSAAMRGPRQAGASTIAAQQLRSWLSSGDLPPRPLGFGHKVYRGPDPRAEIILALVARLDPTTAHDIERFTISAARELGAYPNVDLALAALTLICGLPATTGEVIFTTARSVGLLAHALEEYPHSLRLRPRAVTSSAADAADQRPGRGVARTATSSGP